MIQYPFWETLQRVNTGLETHDLSSELRIQQRYYPGSTLELTYEGENTAAAINAGSAGCLDAYLFETADQDEC